MMWHLLRSLPNKLHSQARTSLQSYFITVLCVSNNLLTVWSIRHKENRNILNPEVTSLNILFCPSNSPRYSKIFNILIQKHFSTAPKFCILFFYSSLEIFWKSFSVQSQKKTFYICCRWVSKAGEKWTACVNPMMSPTYSLCSFSSL